MTGENITDEFIVSEFVICVDSREQAPWHFLSIRGDAKDNDAPILVQTKTATLKTGDYSIEGLENQLCVERKSKDDLFGSLGGGRRRFQAEFERMAKMKHSALVVECSVSEVLFQPPRMSRMDPKTIMRSWISWSIRYPTKWFFMPSRSAAEVTCFRILERYWRLHESGEI